MNQNMGNFIDHLLFLKVNQSSDCNPYFWCSQDVLFELHYNYTFTNFGLKPLLLTLLMVRKNMIEALGGSG